MFDFQFPYSQMPRINALIRKGNESIMRNEEFILNEIREFKSSKKRFDMLRGYSYFEGKQDIIKRKRLCIGENGEINEVNNIPNNRVVDNQYKKLVTQKVNYLLGKKITLDGNRNFCRMLNSVFDNKFMSILKNICQDSINCGIGYMYIYYDDKGNLSFKKFNPWEIVPGWADDEHTKLDYVIRFYESIEYEGKNKKIKNRVEVFDKNGIRRYEIADGRLIPNEIKWKTPYFYYKNHSLSWTKIPIIPFKYNEESSLLKNVKTLQDGLNLIISNFQNAMEEDPRNTILVLKNYDGENLGEFRKNLATYGVVKVRTIDGSDGNVNTLNIDVNSENYKSLIEIFKKAIIENGMGYDAKSDILKGSPNMMNILSMYTDIDIDSTGMENEYRQAMENIIEFVNLHFYNTGVGNYFNEEIKIVFNKNILINESELIDNCIKSLNILSNETVIAKHPWVEEVTKEIKRINKEKEKENEKEINGNGTSGREGHGNNKYDEQGNEQAQRKSQK